MGNEKINVTFGRNHVAEYQKYGEKIIKETKDSLKKAGIPVPVTVPIGAKTHDISEPIKGFELEHAEPVQDEEPQVETDENQDENTDKSTKKTKSPDNGMTDSTHTLNNTFTDLMSKENNLSAKSDLNDTQSENLEQLSGFVDTMEDIDDVGQKHIDFLTQELPESGNLTGGVYTSVDKSKGETTTVFQANITNSWQNKNKTFGIVASGSYGYEREKSTGNPFDELDTDIPVVDDNSVSQARTRNDDDIFPVDENDIIVAPSESATTNVSRSGSFAVNMRLDKKDFVYAAGINSNFYGDGSQVHDQNVSAMYKPLSMGGDLMRRTVISVDDEGKKQLKSQMKLKINLIDNTPEVDFPEIEDNNGQPDESAEENAIMTTDTQGGVNNEADDQKQIAKLPKKKDGTGFDVDFEYDENKCGIITGYGINLINNPKTKTRLTVSPLAGVYDYTAPNGDDDEAIKMTVGAVADFKKQWRDGQSVGANIGAVHSRVAQTNNYPKDSKYIVFSGNYNNPRKNFNANVEAAVVNTNGIKMAYAQATADYQTKNLNVGLLAGVTHFNAFGIKDNDYQLGVKCTYDIPYKTKK